MNVWSCIANPELVELTYCVPTTEQPASVLVLGSVFACVDTYSATDVLHAATAASASDSFDRTT